MSVDSDVKSQRGIDFFIGWSIIMDYGHRLKDGFDFFYKQLFASQDINW